MEDRQQIKEEIIEYNQGDSFDRLWETVCLIDELRTERLYTNIEIDMSTFDDRYGDERLRLHFFGTRYETDKEYNLRKEKAKAIDLQNEQNKRAVLKRLAEEFNVTIVNKE